MSVTPYKKIAVIGISAAGKSTFARKLSTLAGGLPLFHADTLEWLPNWHERPRDEILKLHAEWLDTSEWIIEGWIDTDKTERLNRADLVIDLDYSRWWCAMQALRRMVRKERKRIELPEGCEDRFTIGFLIRVLLKRERPVIDETLRHATTRQYIRFGRPRQTSKWLQSQFGKC